MSSKKFDILIDMDNTLVNMVPYWLDEYNKITGENVNEDQVTDYELVNCCKHPEYLFKILELPGFFVAPEPMPNSLEYFNKLIEDGHNVIIVTQLPRKSDFAARDKKRWLSKYLPNFDHCNLVFTHNKGLVRGDILFDDSPKHIETWKKRNRKGITARISYSYNAFVDTSWVFIKKEKAWKEFYDKIKQMSK